MAAGQSNPPTLRVRRAGLVAIKGYFLVLKVEDITIRQPGGAGGQGVLVGSSRGAVRSPRARFSRSRARWGAFGMRERFREAPRELFEVPGGAFRYRFRSRRGPWEGTITPQNG